MTGHRRGGPAPGRRGTATSSCPWVAPGALSDMGPERLAAEVASRLTLRDELGLVDLVGVPGYENTTAAIPSLCIPAITMQDGPNGLANQDTGVTQLPSSLAVAATFDTDDARAAGSVEGDEARRQGIDVVQGPMLNLLRVPEDGRAYETYGEDPYLVAQMGTADIEGIQGAGVMSEAKHFAAYAQESDRHGLDQLMTTRQLEELYFVPFQAAVEQAHVAGVMCAYGEIDGAPTCADPLLYRTLRDWSFDGFVRSDMSAVHRAIPAFDAGIDAIKPAQRVAIGRAVSEHVLAGNRLADAAQSLLEETFRFDLVAHPLSGRTDTAVDSPAHAAAALGIAEASTVLLKDRGGVLPLDTARLRSIAVIGTDAAGEAMTAGYGGGAGHRSLRRRAGAGDRPPRGPGGGALRRRRHGDRRPDHQARAERARAQPAERAPRDGRLRLRRGRLGREPRRRGRLAAAPPRRAPSALPHVRDLRACVDGLVRRVARGRLRHLAARRRPRADRLAGAPSGLQLVQGHPHAGRSPVPDRAAVAPGARRRHPDDRLS